VKHKAYFAISLSVKLCLGWNANLVVKHCNWPFCYIKWNSRHHLTI